MVARTRKKMRGNEGGGTRSRLEEIIRTRLVFFYCDDPQLRMPEKGIWWEEHEANFHQLQPQPISVEQTKRLRKHGVKYVEYERFTPAEDEIIRRNWQRFAEKNNFDVDDARFYAGLLPHGNVDAKEKREQDMLLTRLRMWPQLCEDLPNRSAQQVQNRMQYVFDPFYDMTSDAPAEITDLQLYKVLKKREKNKSLLEISFELRLPLLPMAYRFYETRKKLRKLKRNRKDFKNDPTIVNRTRIARLSLRRFFDEMLAVAEVDVDEFINLLVDEQSDEAICERFTEIDLSRLRQIFQLHDQHLREQWAALVRKLWNEFRDVSEQFSEPRDAFRVAAKEVMPNFFGREDDEQDMFLALLRCVRKSIAKHAPFVIQKYIDYDGLHERLTQLGCLRMSEEIERVHLRNFPPFVSLQNAFHRVEDGYFRHIPMFKFNIREKLKILHLSQLKARIRAREATDRPLNDPHLFVSTLVQHCARIDPNWEPPAAIRDKVDDAQLFFERKAKYTLKDALKRFEPGYWDGPPLHGFKVRVVGVDDAGAEPDDVQDAVEESDVIDEEDVDEADTDEGRPTTSQAADVLPSDDDEEPILAGGGNWRTKAATKPSDSPEPDDDDELAEVDISEIVDVSIANDAFSALILPSAPAATNQPTSEEREKKQAPPIEMVVDPDNWLSLLG